MTSTIRSVPPMPGSDPVTFEGLLTHFQKYGLSEKLGHRNKVQRYGSYKKLATDPFVEVAFDYLAENAYVALIEAIGYGHFAEQARADHKEENNPQSDL